MGVVEPLYGRYTRGSLVGVSSLTTNSKLIMHN
jgi:hypothetical protein